jgi:hypothetical protein
VLFAARRLIGLAALAGAKAGALGVGRASVEGDILRTRSFGRARRAAVHASGLHRVNELPVGARVACDDPAGQRGSLMVAAACISLRLLMLLSLSIVRSSMAEI